MASALNRLLPLLISAAIRDLEAHDAHLRQLNRWYSAVARRLHRSSVLRSRLGVATGTSPPRGHRPRAYGRRLAPYAAL